MDAFLAEFVIASYMPRNMKTEYDDAHRFAEFEVGDWVSPPTLLIKLLASSRRATTGLTRSWTELGCWHIVWLCHPVLAFIVFHVVFLKKFVGDPPAEVVPLAPIHHGRVDPVPDKVLKARFNRETGSCLCAGSIVHLLIQLGNHWRPSRKPTQIFSSRTSYLP
jgi:hypothetical protein